MRCGDCWAASIAHSSLMSHGIAALLLLSLPASAQVVCALGPGTASYKAADDRRPSPDALELAGKVNEALQTICATNCPVIALFRNSTAANAMLIVNAGQAKLVYAPKFFTAVYENYGDGGIVAIVAHALRHALDDTLGAAWIKSNWPAELRADAWAGCTLAKAGLRPDELAAALAALEKYPSPAHPNWSLRLAPLRTGFQQCGGDGLKFDSAERSRKQ
jgi:hypothetical protein